MPNRSAALLSALMATFGATLNPAGIIGIKSVLAFPETLLNGNLGVAIAPWRNRLLCAMDIVADRRLRLTILKFDTAPTGYGAGIVRRPAPAVPARGAVRN